MLIPDPRGSAGDVVGIEPTAAGALADELERTAAELVRRGPRLQRLVDEAGRAAAGVAPGPALAAAARWAEATATDLRWRIQAVHADPGQFRMGPGPMSFAFLDFPDHAAMVGAARRQALRLRDLVEVAEDGPFHINGGRLRRAYPALVRELRQARLHGVDDPAYAAALFDVLGEGGIRRMLDLSVAAVHDQAERGRGQRPTNDDVVRDLIEPFAGLFAAATRSSSSRMTAIQAALLRPRTPLEFQHLSFLLAAGVAAPPFTVNAATVLLSDEQDLRDLQAMGLRALRGLTPMVGRNSLGIPSVLPLFLPWPDLEVTELVVVRALERSPESAFRFVTTGRDVELILRLDRYPALGDRPGSWEAAARVLELALFEWPAQHPGDLARSRAAFDRIATSVADRGVPDPVKRSLAAIASLHLDGLSERVDPATLTRFFGELARDEAALSVLSLGLGLYAREQLATGLRQVIAADLAVLPPMGELGEELEAISALYGAAGAGIVTVVDDEAEAAQRLAAGLRFAGDAGAGIGLAATSVSGPGAAALGLGVGFLVGKGADAVGRLAAYRGPDVEGYLAGVVRPGVRRIVALEMYANPATRTDLAAVPPPPRWRTPGGGLAVPAPGASEQDRASFWAWFDGWYALAGNRRLRDQTESLSGQIEARVVDDIVMARYR